MLYIKLNTLPKQWEDLLEVIQESNIEILKHFSNGMQAKEIAPLVYLSERTVEGRIYKMRKIFNCRGLTHLIAMALRLKLIE